MLNALTIDLEDYYQVTAFDHIIERRHWDTMETRIERNSEKILAILDEYQVKATFFVLGWIAERHPIVIRSIANAGHEVSSHGYNHQMVHQQSKDDFKEDVKRAKMTIEDIIGLKIKGYRAPTFSINQSSFWALNILYELDHKYDSSIFPIKHDRYGMPSASRFPHLIELNELATILEFPPSTIKLFKKNMPIAGGGYLRLFPLKFLEWGIKRINTVEEQPAIIYLHPWELDPEQPRIPAHYLCRLRHYINLGSTEKKLRHLLGRFRFTTINKLRKTLFQ